MLEIDGKYYAGVEGSILILKLLVAQHYNTLRVLTALDIHVIGQVDNASLLPVDFTGAFGDAYAVGAEHPYDLYIWTRTDETGTLGYWFNIGPIAILGPLGPQGLRGPLGPAGKNVKIYIVQSADELFTYNAVLGDLGIDADGDLWRYNGRQWLLEFNIKGPQGAQGPRGPKGDTGEQGPQGLQGPRGDVGGFIKIIGNLTSIDQLPQPSALGDLTAAYIVGTERNLYIQVGPTSEDAIWTNVGPLNVATMVTVSGEYQNIWDADTKVDKITDVSQAGNFGGAYILKTDGTQGMMKITNTIGSGTLPIRGAGGVIVAGTPSDATHVATKGYVDDIAATKLDKWTGEAGNFRLYGVDSDGKTQRIYNTNAQNFSEFVARFGGTTVGKVDNGGYLTTSDPVNPYHAANKNYVDTVADGKLNIFTVTDHAGDKVYVAKADGTQTTAFIGDGEYYIARYYDASSGNAAARAYLWSRDPVKPYQVATKNYVDTTTKLYRHDIYLLGAMGEQCWFTLINKVADPYTDLSGLPTHAISATGFVDYATPPTQIVAIKGGDFLTNLNTTIPLTDIGTLTDNVTLL